jgi:hypothetical protein
MQNLIPTVFTNIEEEEHWAKKKPKPADHIKTPRANVIKDYYHHGIYISDKEVIHFASEDSDNLLGAGNEIINTDLSVFLKGGELFVREYNNEEKSQLWDAETIISYAKSCVGESGYNLVFNNCEHFCNDCTLGEHKSKQVENVLKPFKKGDRKMGLLDKIGDIIEKVNTKRRIIEEPSKVEIAHIEKMKAIQLAEIEKEKILLSSECEAKLNEFNTKLAIQFMKTQSEEFVKINEKMLEIAKEAQQIEIEKYRLFENASLEVQQKIESYYKEFYKEIDDYGFDFLERKIPMLNMKLSEYEPESNLYKNYDRSIRRYEESFFDIIQQRIRMLHDNQRNLIASSNMTKDRILLDSSKVIEHRMKMLDKSIQYSQQIQLSFNQKDKPKMLSNANEPFQSQIKEIDENEIQPVESRTEKN